MSKVIRIYETGGPEVLRWEDAEVLAPAAHEVTVRHHAVGLNFLDLHYRKGEPSPDSLPAVLGVEGAGVIEATGAAVSDFAVGDRVAYAGWPLGSYAEVRTMPTDRLVKLPAHIDFETAAAVMVQGMTAEYLLNRAHQVRPGDTILIHAATGGVGLIACQWAKALGARVIGTVGSDAKAELARAHGCDEPIVYTREDFVERVKQITAGVGVSVVYDSVGKDTFMKSLNCLRPRGLMVCYGMASGAPAPVEMEDLAKRGSLFVTRPSLMGYTGTRAELELSARALFEMIGSGKLKVNIGQKYALKDAAQAHRDLEARKTTGSTVLLP